MPNAATFLVRAWCRLAAGSLIAVASATKLFSQAPRVPFTSSAANVGRLFIVGGGPQSPALVQEFVDLAGGSGKARVIIFAMASANGLKSGDEKAVELRRLGATAQNVFVNNEQANTDSVPPARRRDRRMVGRR